MSSSSTELVRVELPAGPGAHDDSLRFDDRPTSNWWNPAGFIANVRFLWRTSLPFRTTILAVALTTLTVVIVAIVMGQAIARDLFTSRTNEILAESNRAAAVVRATLEIGAESDEVVLASLRQQALAAGAEQAANSVGYAFYRVPSSGGRVVLQDIASELVHPGLVSEQMRQAVREDPGGQHYQSVEITLNSGLKVPGVIVGTAISVPTAGLHEYYLAYSLEGSQQTLEFVQRTLAVSMAILVLLVAVIVGIIMRAVIRPIRVAAKASRKLAAGHLEERVPERGDDDIGTLARSFNIMADSLQQQIQQLENLSQVQQRFVSDVSHELRTPLTTIRLAGGIVYARRDEFDPTVARSAELLQNQIERFEMLLNDLLEISRYDAGAVELLRRPNSLVAIADDVIGSMTQVALDAGEELIFRAPGGHVEAEFDDRRVTRIVRNLVANAIEHGEGKPIVISVDSNATAVALSVRDYGIGMTEDQVAHVFSRFWRADPSRKRTMGGSGLGLAISMEDAQLHDGRLEVWSAPALGTNFRLTLPREIGEPIVTSPLPLMPEDAGAENYQRSRDDIASIGFSDVSVDTQPITLPVTSATALPAASATTSPVPQVSEPAATTVSIPIPVALIAEAADGTDADGTDTDASRADDEIDELDMVYDLEDLDCPNEPSTREEPEPFEEPDQFEEEK